MTEIVKHISIPIPVADARAAYLRRMQAAEKIVENIKRGYIIAATTPRRRWLLGPKVAPYTAQVAEARFDRFVHPLVMAEMSRAAAWEYEFISRRWRHLNEVEICRAIIELFDTVQSPHVIMGAHEIAAMRRYNILNEPDWTPE